MLFVLALLGHNTYPLCRGPASQFNPAPHFPTAPARSLCCPPTMLCLPSQPFPPRYLCPEEEIARGPACWLWDYLKR